MRVVRKIRRGSPQISQSGLCSSQWLREDKSHFNKSCFLIPNGVDLELFQNKDLDLKIPSDMIGIKKPILGYIGTVGERLDFNTLIDLAQARPDWSMVIIGPSNSKRFFDLRKRPQYPLAGKKEYRQLPQVFGGL